jgi:hypothetical protein
MIKSNERLSIGPFGMGSEASCPYGFRRGVRYVDTRNKSRCDLSRPCSFDPSNTFVVTGLTSYQRRNAPQMGHRGVSFKSSCFTAASEGT